MDARLGIIIYSGAAIICFTSLAYGGHEDICLPEVGEKVGVDMDILQTLEARVGARNFNGADIPMDQVAAILWAGYGKVSDRDGRSVHGVDGISGATAKNRFTIPLAWGRKYLRIYLLLKNEAFLYIPETHKLKVISDKNMVNICGVNAENPSGVILIAADYNEMGRKHSGVAYLSAGSAAQNMCLAGSAMNIRMSVQINMRKNQLIKWLSMPDNVEPIVVLPFGKISHKNP